MTAAGGFVCELEVFDVMNKVVLSTSGATQDGEGIEVFVLSAGDVFSGKPEFGAGLVFREGGDGSTESSDKKMDNGAQ